MKISFRKQLGIQELGIAFFWEMQIDTDDDPTSLVDNLIPELFFDYFYVQHGRIFTNSTTQHQLLPLGNQFLKTIQTQSTLFEYQLPLKVYGARLLPQFAARFSEVLGSANSYQMVNWIHDFTGDLVQFGEAVEDVIKSRWDNNSTAVAYLTPNLEETDQFKTYSPRHKRRLFKQRFGISQKEMRNIQKIHAFLAQTCDFSSDNPHIIDYLDDDHFYDQSHLNHTFKKMTNLSLLDYFDANTILQDNLMAVSYNETAV